MKESAMRATVRKYSMLNIFRDDIENHNYYEFSQLFVAANISNDELVAILQKNRNVPMSFKDNIFFDMMMALIDKIMENPGLEDQFLRLYGNRFSKIKKLIDDQLRTAKVEEGYIGITKKEAETYSYSELQFANYILRRDEYYPYVRTITTDEYERVNSWLQFAYYITEKDALDSSLGHFTFKNTEEPIYPSSQFLKFIRRKKQQLSDYLNVVPEQLGSVIHNKMKSQMSDGGTQLKPGVEGCVELAAMNIIANNNGGLRWFAEVTCERTKAVDSLCYVPDIDKLIEGYYKGMLLSTLVTNASSEYETSFTKIDIARGDFVQSSIREDYLSILYLYELEIFYKMFSTMMETYYKNFSWEKLIGQNLETRYQSIISRLEDILEQKNNTINIQKQQNQALSLKNITDKDNSEIEYLKRINDLNKTIENKDTEILRLKEQIRSQNEYIQLTGKPEEEAVEADINYENLKGMRFLFVGAAQEALPELQKTFPNSKFMTSETTDISAVEVDAVVFLIKWMSHSMYYKVKAINCFEEKPWIYCNTKNFNRICYDIINGMHYA